MAKKDQIDRLDQQILSFLMEDGKMPYTDLAKQLFLFLQKIPYKIRKTLGLE